MKPPCIATWLLRLLASAEDVEYLLSDLGEEFDDVARRQGQRFAARWYWRQTVDSLMPLAASRLALRTQATQPIEFSRVNPWQSIRSATQLAMLKRNLHYTLRLLRRSPGFTFVAVLTLGLGIGANTAVFSVVDAVLLRPLPYRTPERLVSLWQTRAGGSRTTVGPADLIVYIQQNRSFDSLAGFDSISMALTKRYPPEELVGELVSWNLFGVIGVQPAIGRAFVPEDDRPGAEHVVMISDGTWRTRFSADPTILGRSITLNNQPHTVVGVMPAGFKPLTQFNSVAPVAFFVPAAYPPELLAVHGEHQIKVVGRLKPSVPVEQAQRDLDTISADLARQFPRTNSDIRAVIAPLDQDLVREIRPSLVVISAAVGLVVLIACINVANLLIVRALGQRREVAIRAALGASRTDIITDYLTRGIVLSCLGGIAGLFCGLWTRDMLVSAAPASIPRLDALALSPRVLAATAVLSLMTGVVAGLVPALQVVRQGMAPSLRGTELTASDTKSVTRWRGLLLGVEIAAAVVIALWAGLLVRSLVLLDRVTLGFETNRVLTLMVRLPDTRYADQVARLRFFDGLTVRLRRIPGVQSAAFANQFPMRGGWGGSFGLQSPNGLVQADADFQAVSPDYFSTLGIPLIRGRLLSTNDRIGTAPVAVVSQTFVTRLIHEQNPIGMRFQRRSDSPTITIVGVVGEVRRGGKLAELVPQVYLAAAQTNLYPVPLSAVAVRASIEPTSLVGSIQRAVSSIDPDQPIANVRTLDEVLAASMATRRFNMLLLTSFAILALTLAIVGVYGVVAHAATQRTREIGIRIALGATRTNVIALIVRDGLSWSFGGILIGLLAASASTRLMATMLFGVAATDRVTFGAVGLLMLIVSMCASYIPAHRAAIVDPLLALRSE